MVTDLYQMLEVTGPPRQRGQQYGEGAKDKILAAVDYYRGAFQRSSGLDWDGVIDRARRWVEPSEAFAPHLVEEMRGIAEGAGVDFLDILTLNVRGEIIYDERFAELPPEQGMLLPDQTEVDGCTSFAMLADAAGDAHVYCGQNWDWRAAVAGTVVLLRVVDDDGHAIIMQVEAGQVGRQGANSAGLALNANGLGGRFGDAVGVPQNLIRRVVLESRTMGGALRVLLQTKQHIASNALLTHRDGFAIDLETTPESHGWLYPIGGLLVHANHYQATVPSRLEAAYRPFAASSLYRAPRAEAGLRQCAVALSSQQVRVGILTALSDHFSYPDSVCCHPESEDRADGWATLVSSCVDLTTGEYLFTSGTPCDHPYVTLPWNLYDSAGRSTETDALARTA